VNTRAMLAIVRKDQVVSQNKGVTLPIAISILVMFAALLWLVILVPSLVNIVGVSADDLDEIQGLIDRMPAGFQQELAGYDQDQIFVVYFLVMVLVSARAQGFQDANQMGSGVVLLAVLLLFGQVAGVMYFSVALAFVLGLVIWLLDGLLIWFASRSFRRGRLLGA
jgi:hypothetical protein